MPLFMIISGYVTKYSKQITSLYELWLFIKKRTIAYILPWAIWTVVIRGLVFDHKQFLDFNYLLWHMDTGYWYLFSIWTICILFAASQLLVNKYIKHKCVFVKSISTMICCVFFSALLLLVGKKIGMGFLGIKYSVYYMIFFIFGYAFSVIQGELSEKKWYNATIEVVVFLSFLIYCYLLTRYDIALFGESVKEVIIRIFTSITGCIVVFGFGSKIPICKGGAWIGKHSLEIYLIHYLFLNPIGKSNWMLLTTDGIILFTINLIICIIATVLMTLCINQNSFAKMVLFGKRLDS